MLYFFGGSKHPLFISHSPASFPLLLNRFRGETALSTLQKHQAPAF
jgi:hypothetical protein